MFNLLETANELPKVRAADVLWLCFEYGLCLIVVLIAVIGIGFLKRRTKREMRAETVKKSCMKAKKYAEEILNEGEHKGTYMLLGSTKLGHLSACVADAAWYAFQIVNVKRDIVYEEIASLLDSMATELSTQSENGYIPVGEYRTCVEKTIARLDVVMEKLDVLAKK